MNWVNLAIVVVITLLVVNFFKMGHFAAFILGLSTGFLSQLLPDITTLWKRR